MKGYHPLGSLAPRDIVSRAIFTEMQKRQLPCVFLDATFLPENKLKEKFPSIYGTCLRFGIDMTVAYIPVVPAAHYFCGGVLTDVNGCTTIGNLYAIGEVACTGVHGANRLASNSLLEGLIFADMAYQDIRNKIANLKHHYTPVEEGTFATGTVTADPLTITYLKSKVQTIMWDHAGIKRNKPDMQSAYVELDNIAHTVNNLCNRYIISQDLLELRNIITTAKLVMCAAQKRTISLGTHFVEEKAFLSSERPVLA
jgi:L-aspartate oxidase